jgi:hypothetical protein
VVDDVQENSRSAQMTFAFLIFAVHAVKGCLWHF